MGKLFLCFGARPSSLNLDLDGGSATAADCSSNADRVFLMTSYLAAAEKKRKDMQRNNKNKKKEKLAMGGGDTTPRKDDGVTNRPRKKLSRLIKAVLFETILKSSRFQKAKSPRKHHHSHQTRSLIEQSDHKNKDRNDPETCRTTKIAQLAAAVANATDAKPAARTTVEATNLVPKGGDNKGIDSGETKKKKKGTETGSKRNSYRMMQMVYLVLFSLWMTVFLGRFLAVISTTAGIYVCESQRAAALLFAIVGKKKTARVRTTTKKREETEVQCNHARKTNA